MARLHRVAVARVHCPVLSEVRQSISLRLIDQLPALFQSTHRAEIVGLRDQFIQLTIVQQWKPPDMQGKCQRALRVVLSDNSVRRQLALGVASLMRAARSALRGA